MTISVPDASYLVSHDHHLRLFDIAGLRAGWLSFFRSYEKFDFSRNKQRLSGYFDLRVETAINAPEPDYKEFFHFYPYSPCPVFLKQQTLQLFALLKAIAIQALDHLSELRLINAIPLNDIVESQSLVLRVSHYPQTSNHEFLAWEHDDINLLTVIPEASAPGLQILANNGEWICCDPKPGEAVILFGDMLSAYTNGAISSTRHRVVNHQLKRLSFSFFTNPSASFSLSPNCIAGKLLEERVSKLGL
jgi:isopenicillin N synthase-like dioxygenase